MNTTRTLSSRIESLQKAWVQSDFEALLDALEHAALGVLAGKNRPNEPISATLHDGEVVALSSTTHGDGKLRIVAFADPQLFVQNFGPKLNAEVPGQALMALVQAHDACQGIVLNSATSTTSISIGRADILRHREARAGKASMAPARH